MSGFTVSKLNDPAPQQLQQLLQLLAGADFVDAADGSDWLKNAVANSLLAAGVFNDRNELIGFGRVLGDGVSDCYIQDVTIHPAYRGRGLGKLLMEFLLNELAARNIDWVGLIATPGKADFYRKLGFEVLNEYTPMVLKNQRENQ